MDTIASPLISAVNNLHGTPAEERSEALLRVRSSVRKMLTLANEASPNGRDYYLQGADAYKRAAASHSAVCAAMDQLAAELLELADGSPSGEQHKTGILLLSVPVTPGAWPTVHTNGTGMNGLVDPAVAVFRASQRLEDEICSIVPNARDYADHTSWKMAREQHSDRVALIKRVGSYFLGIASHCRRQTSAAAQS